MNMQQAMDIIRSQKETNDPDEPVEFREAKGLMVTLFGYAKEHHPDWPMNRLLLWLEGNGIETLGDMIEHADRILRSRSMH